MKKRTNPLKTKWRNFTTPGKKLENTITDAPLPKVKLSGTFNGPLAGGNSSVKINVLPKANNSGGKQLPGLSKFHNNSKNITKRFNSNTKINKDGINMLYNMTQELDMMIDVMKRAQRRKIEQFWDDIGMSRINKHPALPGKYTLRGARNRRLAVELARIISRLAEDHVGAAVEGDEFWDCDRLAMRKINRDSIYKCRMSREKHNIIIMLDSSPSCSDYSNFYSDIASQCVQFGDIELYDAPNARLVHMYSNKKKAFVEFLTVEDILNSVHRWSLFKNRTIIFFGDFDGFDVVLGGTINNKIHFFCTEDENDIEYYTEGSNVPCNYRNLKIIPNIRSIKSFMKACKKLK